MGATRCKLCGRYIHFCRTWNGKHIPVDVGGVLFVEDKKGREKFFDDQWGEMVRGRRVAAEAEEPKAKRGYIPHFGTCPEYERRR